jgi:hypothetical protein
MLKKSQDFLSYGSFRKMHVTIETPFVNVRRGSHDLLFQKSNCDVHNLLFKIFSKNEPPFSMDASLKQAIKKPKQLP